MDTKQCTKCHKVKSVSCFSSRKEGKIKLRSHCKDCKKKYWRQKRIENHQKKHTYNFYATCSDCKIEKHANEFNRNKSSSNGITGVCKICACKRSIKFNQTTKGKFSQYKSGAKSRSLAFNLTHEEFKTIFLGDCFYCNITQARGIDRVDNNQDYSIDNCVSCCYKCNWMKQAWTQTDFINHCKLITENFLTNK